MAVGDSVYLSGVPRDSGPWIYERVKLLGAAIWLHAKNTNVDDTVSRWLEPRSFEVEDGKRAIQVEAALWFLSHVASKTACGLDSACSFLGRDPAGECTTG